MQQLRSGSTVTYSETTWIELRECSESRTLLDLDWAFEADHDLVEPLFFDGGHSDAKGNALFAQSVADFLAERNLLPDGTPPGSR